MMDFTIDLKTILDVIVAASVISTIVAAGIKKIRKKIAINLFRQIDSTTPSCYISDAITLSLENSENIKNIKSVVECVKNDHKDIKTTLNKIQERLADGDAAFTRQEKKLDESNNELQKSTTRLEILQMINDKSGIEELSYLYDKYKSMGGNSYIDIRYKNYVDSFKN
jgi:septal ring factor EnvC (AmiA/AmiB activator)